MNLAFTGHRPADLHFVPNAERRIKRAIGMKLLELQPLECISGMALGVDQWAAEVCVALSIPFVAAIPFEGHDGVWTMSDRTRYRALLAMAARTHIVCAGGYEPWKMMQRNKWMVDHADMLLAVWDGKLEGGTFNTVDYARSKGWGIGRADVSWSLRRAAQVVVINPMALEAV